MIAMCRRRTCETQSTAKQRQRQCKQRPEQVDEYALLCTPVRHAHGFGSDPGLGIVAGQVAVQETDVGRGAHLTAYRTRNVKADYVNYYCQKRGHARQGVNL